VQAIAAELIVFEAWVCWLVACEPGDPLLEAVAARWMAANRPDVAADRKAVQERVDDAKAALEDLFAARYKRKEFEGPAAEFYPGLLADAEAELKAAERAIRAIPSQTANIGYLLDPILVEEAWEKASVEQKRELLNYWPWHWMACASDASSPLGGPRSPRSGSTSHGPVSPARWSLNRPLRSRRRRLRRRR
jgi:hypothetical protein